MGYTTKSSRGTWFQEQQSMINSIEENEMNQLLDGFDRHFQEAATTMKQTYSGLNVIKDWKKMMENPTIMQEYKVQLLDPILEEFRSFPCSDNSEKLHLESVADQLENAWDEGVKSFLVQESYNVANYLPLSTLDFPALIKQYIRFLGKDLIPVQTASSFNFEQRIFTKYLVNNNTGEEYETPAIYYKKDENGNKVWKKLFDAGKGYKIPDTVINLSDIQAATNKKYSMLKNLVDENGNAFTPTDTEIKTGLYRLSYDFNIKYVQATVNSKSVKVRLPGAGISIDIQNGGVFLNGGITEDMKLAVIDATTGKPTGDTVSFADRLSGVVDFVKGTITASSCGVITGIYVEGYISNENNLRTIGFREYPEVRKFQISDGCRFQLPFTVEDFAEANASLNFNLYARLTQELVTAQEMFEDEYIVDFLEKDFEEYDGVESDAFALETYVHTEYVDLDPTFLSPNFAGDPWEYRTNAINNAIESVIYELCDRGKYDNLGFVIYCNPKAARLLRKFTTWTVQKSTEIGGVQMNHAFGVLTDTSVPIRVVASNRVEAYTTIAAYQPEAAEMTNPTSKELYFNIIAYPMDKFHITYKHLRFARHLTNSPENAAYQDVRRPGGAAMLVTTSAQYRTIKIQGIQGRVICKNSYLVPDSLAGLVK